MNKIQHKMILLPIVTLLLLRNCLAFDLTDEEHDRLPNLFSLENHDKCLRYNGTYCLLRLDLFAEEGNELMQLIRNYSQNHNVKHFNYTYLERGVCVSTTCKDFIQNRDLDDPLQLHEVVQACSNHSIWKEYGLFANVTMELCEKKSEMLIDKADWAFLGVMVAILAVNLIATAVDLLVDDEKKKQFGKGMKMLVCFSIPRNFKYLISNENTDKKPDPLRGINALRNGGSITVVMGHSALILLGGFIDNPHDLEKGFKTVHFSLSHNGTYVVQIFFVLASFLLTYNLEVASETTPINWSLVPKVFLFRLWRLTPPLALVIGFTATWLRHLGSGPLWQRNVVTVVNQCRQYWWSHLLYINNYIADNVFCAKHTWQLATDTQLFLLALVVYVATKNTRWRNTALALMLIVGMILPPLHIWLYDLDLTFFFSPQMSRQFGDRNFSHNYVWAQSNTVGYAVGMYTGYKMYMWHKNGIAFKSRKVATITRLAVTLFLFYLTYLTAVINTDDVSLGTKMAYQAFIRLAVSGSVAIAIMSLSTWSENSVFNWNLWVFLGKMSYSIYLVHLNILHVVVGLRTQLDHMHYLNYLMIECGFYILSVGVAIPFYVLVEGPMTPLVKILLSPSEKKSKDKSEKESKENVANYIIEENKVNDKIDKENGIQNGSVDKIKSL